MKYIVHQRTIKAHFYPNILFNLFGMGREQEKCIKTLHDFTSKVR
uniref:Transposase n=1 Tax=Ascaris lumbricoides TaxID=6252 RepID=A0A0M3HKT2_ASCLU